MMESPPERLPASLPVMVLPCTLFPHGLLPLFIFEPRYRAMLSRSLASDRLFCLGTRDPADEDSPIAPISTAGLVRACVTHDNGTSHLLLLGLQRIRLLDWEQTEPFRVARVEAAPSEREDESLALSLARDAIELTRDLAGPGLPMSRKAHDHLGTLQDPSAIADVIAHSFVTEPRHRQLLLETLDVVERLHLLGQLIQSQISGES